MSSTHNLVEAGIVVGEASSNEFYFASKNEEYPPKWEYLVVYSTELINGKLEEVPVVAQVEKIASVPSVQWGDQCPDLAHLSLVGIFFKQASYQS